MIVLSENNLRVQMRWAKRKHAGDELLTRADEAGVRQTHRDWVARGSGGDDLGALHRDVTQHPHEAAFDCRCDGEDFVSCCRECTSAVDDLQEQLAPILAVANGEGHVGRHLNLLDAAQGIDVMMMLLGSRRSIATTVVVDVVVAL